MSLKRSPIDGFAAGLARLIVGHRWTAVLLSVGLMISAGYGVSQLQLASNYRVFFSEDNPELLAFDEFEASFSKNDNFLFVLVPSDGRADTAEVMSVVEEMTERAWQIPFASRVDSLTNFQHTYARGDELVVEDLISDAALRTYGFISERVDLALDEPLLAGRLIARDRGATGINVTLQLPGESQQELIDALAAVRELASDIESRHPELEVAVTGVSALNSAFAESTMRDGGTLFPAMFVVLIIATWLILRSLSATFVTVLVINFATIVALGFAGWSGIALSPFSGSAPVVILTLAIADSIHILLSTQAEMRRGLEKKAALVEAIRVNFLAVSITSITTIIGFLALNFSDAPPFNDLGNISAVGIAAAWFFSIVFLPALLSIVPFKVQDRGNGGLKRLTSGLAKLVTRRYRIVLAGMVALTVGSVAVIPSIDLNDEWIKYFDDSLEFRQDADRAIEEMTGLYILEYVLPANGDGAISEPEYLNALDAYTSWLREQPEVQHVFSYSDIIRRLNRNMNGDDPAFDAIPQDRNLAAQYLLLFELSLPLGLDLNDRIDVSKSSTRVSVTLNELPTAQTREFLRRSSDWLATNAPNYADPYATGATVLFANISLRNIRDMVGGNIVAVLLIAIVMVIALRSFGYGVLSVIPNALPLVLTFGLWAVLVGQVGMAAATVSATALGIIVDNTVHFLTKYLRARRERDLSREEAIHYAFDNVGLAIAANAIILAAGFAALSFSTFKVTAEMGIMTAIAIVCALIVDFLLLPSLLMLGREKSALKTMEISNA